jgi:hypothetical protein
MGVFQQNATRKPFSLRGQRGRKENDISHRKISDLFSWSGATGKTKQEHPRHPRYDYRRAAVFHNRCRILHRDHRIQCREKRRREIFFTVNRQTLEEGAESNNCLTFLTS